MSAALVTGAPRRIGRALALTAADAGYDIAVHCRAIDQDVESLIAEIFAKGHRAVAVVGDLNEAHAPADMIARAHAKLGALTLLINNASLFDDDRIDTLTAESFDAHLHANLRAPILLSQAFAAQVPAEDHAMIVNILDQRVWKPTPQYFSYAISKAALWQATQMMAQALAPRIRVNGIGPGPTLASIHQTEATFAAEAAGVPLQRHATPEEITHALRYLIEAGAVTGQMIAVDAGQHLGWRTPDIVDP